MFQFNIIIDDIDDNEYDVTWGGTKKSRYLYSYTLQSPDLFPNINDTNQTESEYIPQSKSTSNNHLIIKVCF